MYHFITRDLKLKKSIQLFLLENKADLIDDYLNNSD
jgi:hypothetical protein